LNSIGEKLINKKLYLFYP